MPGDDDLAIRQRLALDWSRGALDRLRRYQDAPPQKYTSDDDVLVVFNTMGPKQNGVTVGTLFDMAKQAGWPGNPHSDGKPAAETFAGFTGVTLQPEAGEAEPEDIFEDAPPSTLPDVTRDMLPEVLMDFAEDSAERIGVTVSMVAVPALILAAASVHDGYKLQPKEKDTGWLEPARLWSMVIDRPAGAKTPAADAAVRIGQRLQAKWSAEYAAALAEYERTKDAVDEDCEYLGIPTIPRNPPTERRLIVSDYTTEQLANVLVNNTGGVLIYVNELMGLFGGLNEYKGGAGKDRQLLLELNDGAGRSVDRVKSGHVFIPNWGASIFGTIQPGALRALVKQRSLITDGLFQRFLPFFGRTLGTGVDREPNMRAIAGFESVIDRLTNRLPRPSAGPIVSTLDPAARHYWDEINNVRLSNYQDESLHEGVAGWIGKLPKVFARLILTLHAIECVTGAPADEVRIAPVVPEATVAKAYKLLTGFFEPHARAVYGKVFDYTRVDAIWIAEHILAHGLKTITLRRLKKNSAGFAADENRALAAMRYLYERFWVEGPTEGNGGRGSVSVQWQINPKVHTLFSDMVDEIRQRRGERGAGLAA